MNAKRRSLIAVPAACVAVTILLCTVLFWARTYCAVQREALLNRSIREVSIFPSRVLDPNRTQDPNLAAPFVVTAKAREYCLPAAEFGIARYVMDLHRDFFWTHRPYLARFDSSLGLFVYEREAEVRRSDGSSDEQPIIQYAGPQGISERPDEQLGRFISPITDEFMVRPQVVYDRAQRRFFTINWEAKTPTVRTGPELAKNKIIEPIQLGLIWKNPMIDFTFPSPRSRDGWRARAVDEDHVFVLDASGRIDRLDLRTLEYTGLPGRLPSPTPPIGSTGTARPGDLIAYGVYGFEVARGDSPEQWMYGGYAVASLSREGLALRLEYFDPHGQIVVTNASTVEAYDDPVGGTVRLSRAVDSAEAAYFVLPGVRSLTWAKLLAENLHPPALLLASYLGGPHFEATTGYRSMFLLPDSFVAMVARGYRDAEAGRYGRFLGYMLPSLILCGLLSLKLNRDGIRIGMPWNTRKAWIAATMVLGLPAYVTFRLMRPEVSLVTCPNCGQGRRPDREKCHSCGSVWEVLELTPPAWRVVCAPEQVDEISPVQTEETGLPANGV